MVHITDDTVLIGSAELRRDMPSLAKDTVIKTIIVLNKGKPVAVLENFEQFREKERLLDEFEDLVLGSIAKERESKAKKSDYISAQIVAKKLGVKI